MTRSQQIREVVDSMIGIPYQLFGRDQNSLDCLGVVLFFFKNLGIYIPDPWTDDPKKVLSHEFHSFFERVKLENVEIGDVASYSRDKRWHLGIVVDGGIMHIMESTGVVITRKAHLPIEGFYRLKELAP